MTEPQKNTSPKKPSLESTAQSSEKLLTEPVTPDTSYNSPGSSDKAEKKPPVSPSKSTMASLEKALEAMSPDEQRQLYDKLKVSSGVLRKSLAWKTAPTFFREVMEMQTPDHILEWIELLASKKKLLVEASRDHSKSWTFSYGYPLYRVNGVRDGAPPIFIALISYSEDQAKKNLMRIRKKVESDPDLRWLMPKLKSHTWDSGALHFSNGCIIEAFGFGSSIRGGHFHIVIIDDPCKDHGTMTVQDQANFFYGVVIPAVRRGEQIVITGNPIDKKDFLLEIEKNKAFHCVYYPCWNEKKEPLWPEQYTMEDLLEKQEMIPAHIFQREYLLRRVSSEDAKFKEEWIVYYDPQEIEGEPQDRVMTIDPALSPGGDEMGVAITATTPDGYINVLVAEGFRGDFHDAIAKLCDLIEEFKPDRIGCEKFAFQEMYRVYLEEELERRGISRWVEPLTTDTKKKKSARIEALQPAIRRGRVRWLRTHKPAIDQLLLWDPQSKGNEDDIIDALAWQVPWWDTPEKAPEQRKQVLPGSFMDDFNNRRTSRAGRDYLSTLFKEFNA